MTSVVEGEERREAQVGLEAAADKGGNWMGESEGFWSGGSVRAGGGRRASPEAGDDGSKAEDQPGMVQRDCIGKCVREKLTFVTNIL